MTYRGRNAARRARNNFRNRLRADPFRVGDVISFGSSRRSAGARTRCRRSIRKRSVAPTKSGKIREVPLFGMALAAARAWLAALPKYTATRKHPRGRNPHGLMFPAERGGFRSKDHAVRWAVWLDAKTRAGITCASSLVSGWWGRAWTLIEVKEMLGHASITTTERYAHLAGTALQLAAKETNHGSMEHFNSRDGLPPQQEAGVGREQDGGRVRREAEGGGPLDHTGDDHVWRRGGDHGRREVPGREATRGRKLTPEYGHFKRGVFGVRG